MYVLVQTFTFFKSLRSIPNIQLYHLKIYSHVYFIIYSNRNIKTYVHIHICIHIYTYIHMNMKIENNAANYMHTYVCTLQIFL